MAVILPQDRDPFSCETNVRSLSPSCAIKAVVLSPPSGCLWQLFTLLPKGSSDIGRVYIASGRNLGDPVSCRKASLGVLTNKCCSVCHISRKICWHTGKRHLQVHANQAITWVWFYTVMSQHQIWDPVDRWRPPITEWWVTSDIFSFCFLSPVQWYQTLRSVCSLAYRTTVK